MRLLSVRRGWVSGIVAARLRGARGRRLGCSGTRGGGLAIVCQRRAHRSAAEHLAGADVIYAAAPLIGLTGTVTGLLEVFSQISPDTGLPDPVKFTSGVALALSATVLGLCIAIPSLVGSGYLQRKVENYAAQLDVLLERILQRGRS